MLTTPSDEYHALENVLEMRSCLTTALNAYNSHIESIFITSDFSIQKWIIFVARKLHESFQIILFLVFIQFMRHPPIYFFSLIDLSQMTYYLN